MKKKADFTLISRNRLWSGLRQCCIVSLCLLQGCLPHGEDSRVVEAPRDSQAVEAPLEMQAVETPHDSQVADMPRELLTGLDHARPIGAAQPFSEGGVYGVEVPKAGNWYDAQLTLAVTNRWKAGDTLMLSVELRATKAVDESAEGWVLLALQQASPPNAKIFRIETSVPQEWTTLKFPFVATSEIDPENAQVILGFGKRQQRIELRSVSLKNHGDTPVDSLKGTELTYAGRSPDAPWRAEANERIDKYRKTDLTVSVVDEAGLPVPGAEVTIKQTRHAFPLGSAVAADLLLGDSPDARRYQDIVQRDFNRVALENALKVQPWEEDRQRALDALHWLKERNIEVRGHVLVWPSYRKMYMLRQYANTPVKMEEFIRNHIVDEASAVGNQVVQWDVLNEPYDNHDVMDILGDEPMVEWYKIARQASPETELFINDYGILSGGGSDTLHQDHYEKTIRYLLDNGAPLDGIGLQSHFSSSLTSPEKVWTLLNRYGAFGKKLYISELDVDVAPPELQADYLRDFMTLCFSHPQVDGIQLWGFWAGRHWKPQCALYNKDWSLSPVGQAWRDLVFNQWWTEEQALTDEKGCIVSRVFLGDYEISAASPAGSASATVAVDLLQGTDVHLVLKNK